MIDEFFKNGSVVSFSMSSEDAELKLVGRFYSKTLAPNSVLDLKAKGSFPISQIEDMVFSQKE